ncbi:MAG: hypothetical protein JWQ23_4212 [Herminiimonas sp.]|nr:hypothetical protein [Herminiimonas sp.]
MKPAPTVADAIAGARHQPAIARRGKSVLVAGAAGRLGERVLARVLGSPDYERIYVLAAITMPSTEKKLIAVTQPGWTFPVDHVIAVVGDEGAEQVLPRRKRTEVFDALAASQVVPLAHQARANGAARFMLVTPTNILSQPSALHGQVATLMDAELNAMGFESLLLVRPSDHETRRRGAGFAKRFLGLIIDTAAGLMAGTKYMPLSIEDTARAAVRAIEESGDGLVVIETDRLQYLLKS